LVEPSRLQKIYRTAIGENYPNEIKIIIGEDEIPLKKVYSFRYGDNPGQTAALFAKQTFFRELKTGKQGLSKINFEDAYRAHSLLSGFDRPACAYMKHLNPSGVAIAHLDGEPLRETIRKAREADSQASFGATVGLNREVGEEEARELASTYIECVAAPSFTPDAVTVLEGKRDLRIIEVSLPKSEQEMELHLYPQGFATLSAPYKNTVKTKDDVAVVTKRSPTDSEYKDLFFSWAVCGHVRSNAVVVTKDLCTVGIGTGQQDRVTAAKLAVEKAEELGHKERIFGSAVASDGFIPFRDNIDMLAKYYVSSIIQPGGSLKDKEVIDACDEVGIAMVFTGARCFSHF
jgi:phosphoribosylaminoimidazolecarboxamide formyltransferase/IMP cyclohydrolase